MVTLIKSLPVSTVGKKLIRKRYSIAEQLCIIVACGAPLLHIVISDLLIVDSAQLPPGNAAGVRAIAVPRTERAGKSNWGDCECLSLHAALPSSRTLTVMKIATHRRQTESLGPHCGLLPLGLPRERPCLSPAMVNCGADWNTDPASAGIMCTAAVEMTFRSLSSAVYCG